MDALKFIKKYYVVAFAIMLFLITSAINRGLSKPIIVITKQNEAWNLNVEMIKNFNLGFRRLESSLLWISTILESDQEHYKKKDLNSWMFLRFNSISELEPKFYENYSFGGIYLSIIKDDLPGATVIYNKGLSHYGNDFALLRDAGFHFYFEVGDFDRAYKIYSKLKGNPRASSTVISTLARLEKSHGNPEAAFNLLLDKYNQLSDKKSFLAVKIQMHLYALKAEIDLNCLNSVSEKNCSTKDFNGDTYFKKNGSYQSIKPWEPFRIKNKI